MPAILSQVVFRTDVRPEIGYGHFFRCFALAQAFVTRGTHCVFASRIPAYMRNILNDLEMIDKLPGGIADWNEPSFIAAIQNSNLLITDLYEIDPAWQRHSPIPILAITDPPLKHQHCDILLLPTVFDSPTTAGALTAPAHALIRSDITIRRSSPKTGDRILINFGGGEDHGLTLRIVEALSSDETLRDIVGTVVLGDVSDEYAQSVRTAMVLLRDMVLTRAVADMATLIADHDWAIGAPGGSALERACLGLAQVLVPIADNQHSLGNTLQDIGAACTLAPDVDTQKIAAMLRGLRINKARRLEIATKGFQLFDGQGAERVVECAEMKFGKSI